MLAWHCVIVAVVCTMLQVPFTLVVTTTPPETIVLCYLALGTFVILLAAQLKYKRYEYEYNACYNKTEFLLSVASFKTLTIQY